MYPVSQYKRWSKNTTERGLVWYRDNIMTSLTILCRMGHASTLRGPTPARPAASFTHIYLWADD